MESGDSLPFRNVHSVIPQRPAGQRASKGWNSFSVAPWSQSLWDINDWQCQQYRDFFT